MSKKYEQSHTLKVYLEMVQRPARAADILMYDLWRNHPSGDTTYNTCPTPDCEGVGRGTLPCIACLAGALSELSDDGAAVTELVACMAKDRELRSRLRESAGLYTKTRYDEP